MNKKHVKESLLLVVFMFLVATAFSPSRVTADVIEPFPFPLPDVEIQGAKLVSEGGYFYMEIRNIGTEPVLLTIKVPKEFEFEEFDENAGTSTSKRYLLPFHLEPYETIRFHFHAPFIGGEEEQTFDFLLERAGVNLCFFMTVLSLGSNKQQENNDPNTITEIVATIAAIIPIAGAVGFVSWLSIIKVTRRVKHLRTLFNTIGIRNIELVDLW